MQKTSTISNRFYAVKVFICFLLYSAVIGFCIAGTDEKAMDNQKELTYLDTDNNSSKGIHKGSEEVALYLADLANLSDKAKLVVCQQLLDITFFPKREFTEKQFSSGWTAPIYDVDKDSDAIRVYREGLLAGYIYSLGRCQDDIKWKKMQDINNSLLSTESEFNGLIVRLATNLCTVGVSAGEDAYIHSFGMKKKENIHLYNYFLLGFVDGRGICESLWQDAIKQLKDTRKEFLRIGQTNGNDNACTEILPTETNFIDAPALEALLFLRMTFPQKTALDRDTFHKVNKTITDYWQK